MKRKKVFLLMTMLAMVCIAFGFQNTPDHKILFEKAKFAMETKGDLQGAIKLFQEIIAKYPQEKEYAARAQFYIGACYEKLGNIEAIKAYELVLKKYADQPELVVAARERLAVLRQEAATGLSELKILPDDIYLEATSLSADGTMIAGVEYSTGQNIAAFDIAAKRLLPATHFDWSFETCFTDLPIWSPDNKEIAYQVGCLSDPAYGRAAELQASSLDGKSRLLYRNEHGGIAPCAWLSDGRGIVVVMQDSEKSFSLGLVPASGGSYKALHTLQGEIEGSNCNADASPDGRFIVFDDGPALGKHDIYIIDIKDQSITPLTDHPADDKQPLWSPDGKHIIYLSQRHGGWALWGIAVKDGKPEGQPFMIKEGMQDATLKNFTKTGLLYEKSIRVSDIYIMEVDPKTGEITKLPRPLAYTPSGGNSCPIWSPDGKYLAFASHTKDAPQKGDVVVMSVAGGEVRKFSLPVSYASMNMYDLRWLPDGSGLGFSFNGCLYRLSLSSGEWKTWTIPANRIEWNPDGTAYLYCRTKNPTAGGEIIEHNLETGVERVVYKSAGGESPYRGLKFSRDHRWLAWQSIKAPKDMPLMDWKYGIRILDIQSGEVQGFLEQLGSPAFSADGQLVIAVGSYDKNNIPTALHLVSPREGSSKKIDLGSSLPKDSTVYAPDWSPDGSKIAFGTRSSKRDSILMKNVIAEKR